jgi:TipAS antibiotic-recognition domain
MYVDDERFRANYDKVATGLAEFPVHRPRSTNRSYSV